MLFFGSAAFGGGSHILFNVGAELFKRLELGSFFGKFVVEFGQGFMLNRVDDAAENSWLIGEVSNVVIFRESYADVDFFAGLSAYELIFKGVNEFVGADVERVIRTGAAFEGRVDFVVNFLSLFDSDGVGFIFVVENQFIAGFGAGDFICEGRISGSGVGEGFAEGGAVEVKGNEVAALNGIAFLGVGERGVVFAQVIELVFNVIIGDGLDGSFNGKVFVFAEFNFRVGRESQREGEGLAVFAGYNFVFHLRDGDNFFLVDEFVGGFFDKQVGSFFENGALAEIRFEDLRRDFLALAEPRNSDALREFLGSLLFCFLKVGGFVLHGNFSLVIFQFLFGSFHCQNMTP